MTTITLRPLDADRDLAEIAPLLAAHDEEPLTEDSLRQDLYQDPQRLRHKVAENEHGELMGFYWTYHSKVEPGRVYLSLVVKPGQRGQGAGRLLYADMEQAVQGQARLLSAQVWDTSPESRAFIERRGFVERSHSIAMSLDLIGFDDRPYTALITRLEDAGFYFTSLQGLGNTVEAQRQLFALNDATSLDIPDANGEHPWASFEDFQQHVCGASWYIPAGQKVVIDSATGSWAGMSAITRFAGADYAYNLHTGVARAYRGRKLAQAVKVTALRYAYQELQVETVRTHHNSKNAPIIAIDRKFGYVPLPGKYLMLKILGN